MSTLQASLEQLLSSQERVRRAVQCWPVAPGPESAEEQWLVVVVHGESDNEEGSIVIVKRSREELEIAEILAITSGFRVSVAQQQAKEVADEVSGGRDDLSLIMETSPRSRIQVRCRDSDAVKQVVSDMKMLAVIANENRLREGSSHAWLEPYIRQGSVGTSKGKPATSRALGGWFWDKEIAVDREGTPTQDSSGDPENPLDPAFRRNEWLRQRLFARQTEFSRREPLNIRLATYNVNDFLPRAEDDLTSLMGGGHDDSDMIILGLQEVDLRNQSLILSASSDRDDAWADAFFNALGEHAPKYELLCRNKFVGVLQIVIIKKTLRKAISTLEMSEKPIGLLGLMGNKAGVAARMKVYDSTFCFVTAHLAAFANADDRRRENYEELMRGLTFPSAETTTSSFEEFGATPIKPAAANYLFFLGDLNFRIALPEDEVHALVDKNDWQGMLKHDQLKAQIAAGRAFAGFTEGDIDFRPSFKYKHGTLEFDKKRGAAFTDRILWRTGDSQDTVKYKSYTCHPEVLLSDHLPVSASVECSIRVVDEGRRAEVYSEILQQLKKLEKEYTPILTLEPTSLDFGEAYTRVPIVRDLHLHNPGRVAAKYTIAFAGGSSAYWASPAQASLLPGETQLVKIKLQVTDRLVDPLNQGQSLGDILKIDVSGGAQHTVDITAKHVQTCFGASLQWLCHLEGPARSCPPAGQSRSTPLSSPRELWRMIEFLMAHGKGVDGLFVDTGDDEVQQVLRECIDTGADFPTDHPQPQATIAMGDLLVQFLEVLADPVIPTVHHSACCASTTRDEAYACLDLLPHTNTNVLISVTSLLRFLLEGELPEKHLDDYAAIFAACLFRIGPGIPNTADDVANRRRFVKLLIDL